ncbi:helix-turn-helix transcriptional regulator [Acaryochloris sp. CCMEE 5410]|uniref:helix-turn-helix transcriptional regulator n=1 Tax=Acaryochloris sp. CCMEE 5410 TaxID=310037 RepID=UPI0021D38B49|nr:helix-turn-helix transcriptional regulator [Acaryochloris sp. CCMEE 5410]
MGLTPLIHAIISAKTESELRSQLLDKAGYCTGSQAWGLDLLDYQQKIMGSDLQGLPVSFCNRYQAIGRDQDITSQQMLRQHIPIQLCSLSSQKQPSNEMDDLFKTYHIEHGVVAPILGSGQLLGGLYFLRHQGYPPFKTRDLLRISTLCQHLAVQFTTLRFNHQASAKHAVLTDRELEIVDLVAQGFTNREISHYLHISVDGVKQRLKRLYRKVGVANRAALVAKVKGVANGSGMP